MNCKQTAAVFDFDGTLVRGDSLIPFLFFAKGTWPTIGLLLLASPYLIGFALRLVSRQRAKERVLTLFFQGMKKQELKEIGISFAKEKIPSLLKKEALERLHWHQKQNHLCILATASIDIYMEPLGKSMGFANVISTVLETTTDGTITGKISGLNCWGPEKGKRVKKMFIPREEYCIYSYGDSRGDQEILELADHPRYRTYGP